MKSKAGFSLLEILVAIAILSTIAVLGHTEYLGYFERAKVSEALDVLESYQALAMQYRARNGTIDPYYVLFSSTDTAGLLTGSPGGTSASKTMTLKNITKLVAIKGTSGGNTYLLLGAKLVDDSVILSGADFVYLGLVETPAGVVTWTCGQSTGQANNVPVAYMPKTCINTLP
ncbi:MAG TPA: type II secretion system protein [Gammaproteobacteria bacterium]|nr:type II secretion system protein [Gammaproteobacteria bacterium]